ncbi:Zinc finger protein CONSTANS-LIKE 10 [Apostasia shenzhenica]|uniref:Zinc finger protein CONSTANS-LIKE 10 n=1 Tax=Apostasia shenzhenica TaxID=1088818 RepID=A0A2H9ZQV9_9ASPA|nr:Zinc finger protein CONSTANS-LIKE 10 [Apostasia shenzhenica]
MKGCELCHRVASLYCKSDQASLCWECDAKVHGANFLVARHGRSLLCRSCQAPTPWRAAGARFSPTISVCENCAALGKMASDWERDEEEGEAQGSRGGEADRMMQDEDAHHQEESQVVPWKLAWLPAASSSSGEGFSSTDSGSAMFLKRIRENADLDSSDFPSPSSNRSQLDTSRLMPAPSPSRSDDQVADSTVSASFRSSKDRQRSIFRSDARPS